MHRELKYESKFFELTNRNNSVQQRRQLKWRSDFGKQAFVCMHENVCLFGAKIETKKPTNAEQHIHTDANTMVKKL